MCQSSLLTQTMGSRDWRTPFPVREHPQAPCVGPALCWAWLGPLQARGGAKTPSCPPAGAATHRPMGARAPAGTPCR